MVDAEDETPLAFTATEKLPANAASVMLTDVAFDAARAELPEIAEGAQAAVAFTTNAEGNCVFAVANGGEWSVTETEGDPEKTYTVKVDFAYASGANTVSYSVSNETGWVTLAASAVNPASVKVSTVKLAGSGSLAALTGSYPMATIDFGDSLQEGVASVTVNGDPLVGGKASVPKGTSAEIAITPVAGWTVDPAVINLESVTEDYVDYTGAKFPATVARADGWAVVSADASVTNFCATLSAALAALADGETLMPTIAGESDLSVKPTTFSKNDFKAVIVDCPFIVTNNDVTVDFRGRVIRDAVAPEELPAGADGSYPYLVMVTGGATNVTIRNGFLFGSGYDVTSSEPKESDRRLVGVKNAAAEIENCVMFGPGVSGILRVGQNASLVVRDSWFDGQGDGCMDVVMVSDGSSLTFDNVDGFWNPDNFWGTLDGVNASFTEITGEQFSIIDGSTLTLNNTVISNNVTQWIEDLKVSPVAVRGADNGLVLGEGSGIWMGGDIAKVTLADAATTLDSNADYVANDEIVCGLERYEVAKSSSAGAFTYSVVRSVPLENEQVGVCSWTWHADMKTALEQMQKDGRYNGVQLALAPWLGIDNDTLYFGTAEGKEMWDFIKRKIASGELNVMSTMINYPGEDYTTLESITNTQGYMWGVATNAANQAERWETNLFYTAEAARLTAELGVKTLTTESGFICINQDLMFERVKAICATCQVYGVDFLIESGPQHSLYMTNLMARVNASGYDNIGINFDPGDTALFGAEDPVASWNAMLPWIRQVHVKDCKENREQ